MNNIKGWWYVGQEEQLLMGERIRETRIASGLTQEATSELLGISLRYYQMLERGEKSLSLERLKVFSRKLNVSLDYLVYGSLPQGTNNPISNMLEQMAPRQRDGAVKILQLYYEACSAANDE